MPALDGFGLCAAVRQDPVLARIPLVLMTNSYVDEPDRQLARTAGADEFVIRTPSLLEVVEALRSSLSGRGPERRGADAAPGALEKVWTRRVVSQLERQVAINHGMARRSAILSAELTVLRGMSDALSKRQDIRVALHDVVEACVDAGSFSLGLLQVAPELPGEPLSFGPWDGWSSPDTARLIERANQALEAAGTSALWLATPSALLELSPLLARNGVEAAAIVRVTRGDSALGTLLMTSKASSASQDRLAFLEAVAAQIAQALTLTRAFADKEASERRATEQANVLRSVLETVAEGVVVTDERGDFLLWNPAAERILGTGSARVPAKAWPERFGLSFADSMLAVPSEQVPLVRALAGEVVDERQAYQVDIAGASKHVTISARPLDRDGGVSGAVAVLRDVTEEKATQTRLLVADRMASVGMLAAGVAHEINNPLAAVVANLELASTALREVLAQPGAPVQLREVAKMLDEANEAGARVRGIVTDLRVFSRSEADSMSAVNIHEVLSSVLRLAKNELRHRAEVVLDYADDVSFVEGNESRLGQVFLNLVMNAVQALPTGQAEQHEIRIRTRALPNAQVLITVADTGEGISAEAMNRLFVPFFTTKGVGIGTGLGLSICQRLVTACGGEIRAESRPGEGAAFHVTLRAAAAPPAPAAPVRSERAAASSVRRAKILMIDDEPVILSILTRALGESHDCSTTTRAADALARLRGGEHFDLILCDLMMPALDGKEFHVQLSQFAPEHAQRMIFLTGGAFTPALQAFLATVSNERISKPFDVAKLRASINARVRDLPAQPGT